MKVIVEIPDNKLNFALEVLRSLSFVKKANPVISENSIISDLNDAVEYLNLVKEGKAKAKPARDLLNEL